MLNESLKYDLYDVDFLKLLDFDTLKLGRLFFKFFESKGYRFDIDSKKIRTISGHSSNSNIYIKERWHTNSNYGVKILFRKNDIGNDVSLYVDRKLFITINTTVRAININNRSCFEVFNDIDSIIENYNEDLVDIDTLTPTLTRIANIVKNKNLIFQFSNPNTFRIQDSPLAGLGLSRRMKYAIEIVKTPYTNFFRFKESIDALKKSVKLIEHILNKNNFYIAEFEFTSDEGAKFTTRNYNKTNNKSISLENIYNKIDTYAKNIRLATKLEFYSDRCRTLLKTIFEDVDKTKNISATLNYKRGDDD